MEAKRGLASSQEHIVHVSENDDDADSIAANRWSSDVAYLDKEGDCSFLNPSRTSRSAAIQKRRLVSALSLRFLCL
jgi:hypothetical protein